MLKRDEANKENSPFLFDRMKFIIASILFIVGFCYAFAIEENQTMNNAVGRSIADAKDYDSVEPFVNGYAVVCKNDTYGLIDEEWNEIIRPQGWFIETFDHWDDDFVYTDYGFCILCTGDYYSVYDIGRGEVILEDYYQGIEFHRFRGNLYALAYKYEVLPDLPFYDYTEENTPLIDVYRLSKTTTPVLILSQKATRCDCDDNSDAILFNTALDGRTYCAYDHTGKLLFSGFESQDSELYRSFHFSYLVTKDSNSNWVIVDDTGMIVLRGNYDYLYEIEENGLIAFRDSGLYGFINLHGEVVVPAEYEKLYNFYNDQAIAVSTTKDLYFIIDNNGSKLTSAPIGQAKVTYFDNVPYLMEKSENGTMIYDYNEAGWVDYDQWILLRHPVYALGEVYEHMCRYYKNIYIAYTGDEWLFVRSDGCVVENTVIGDVYYPWGPVIEFNRQSYSYLW